MLGPSVVHPAHVGPCLLLNVVELGRVQEPVLLVHAAGHENACENNIRIENSPGVLKGEIKKLKLQEAKD